MLRKRVPIGMVGAGSSHMTLVIGASSIFDHTAPRHIPTDSRVMPATVRKRKAAHGSSAIGLWTAWRRRFNFQRTHSELVIGSAPPGAAPGIRFPLGLFRTALGHAHASAGLPRT
jgi:hypothetical protein